jgi:hypothetical protein
LDSPGFFFFPRQRAKFRQKRKHWPHPAAIWNYKVLLLFHNLSPKLCSKFTQFVWLNRLHWWLFWVADWRRAGLTHIEGMCGVLDFNVGSSKTGGTAHSKEASALGIRWVSPLSSVIGWHMFRLLITGASCFNHLVIHE